MHYQSDSHIYTHTYLHINICVCIYNQFNREIKATFGRLSRVFTNGLGDQGSILSRVIPKTQKMVLDSTLLHTQHYKVRI